MKKTAIISTLVLSLAALLAACSSSSNSGPGLAPLEMMNKAQSATESIATNENGLSKGTGAGLAALFSPVAMNFDPDVDCSIGGGPANGSFGDAGYAMTLLKCSVLKRPDGPDTVRGGFDRVTGLLCAIGAVNFDAQERDVTLTIDNKCFSDSFITAACGGPASCTATAQVAGHPNTAGVAPALFDRYLTIKLDAYNTYYTLAFRSTGTSVSGAIMNGLPTSNQNDVDEAFAFHLDTATNSVRYEGRFNEATYTRHIRINMNGDIDASFNVKDVDLISFVQGEYHNNGGGTGQYVSIHGTLTAGRRLLVRSSNNIQDVFADWVAGDDDGDCYGEDGALCTDNNGITNETDGKFFLKNGATNAFNWFKSHSYLGSVSNTVTMADVWQ